MAALVESMAWAGNVPWHGLGKKVLPDLTPDQMLNEAGLDWKVNKIPAYAEVDGKKVSVNRSVLVRDTDNKILTVVSNDWNHLQNHEAFEFFNEFVMAGDMEMHTAGSLKGGQLVWALAKVKESFELFKGDKVDSYLLFTNPHQFGKSIDVRFTPIRVVCNNTLTLSLNSASNNFMKVSHRRTFNADEVKEAMGIASTKLNKYKDMAAFLGSKSYTKEAMVEYFKKVFGSLQPSDTNVHGLSRNANKAIEILETQPGANYAQGTWWQPYNAVTFMSDHLIGRSADTRLTSAWYGPNKLLKLKALKTAVEFAKAA